MDDEAELGDEDDDARLKAGQETSALPSCLKSYHRHDHPEILRLAFGGRRDGDGMGARLCACFLWTDSTQPSCRHVTSLDCIGTGIGIGASALSPNKW